MKVYINGWVLHMNGFKKKMMIESRFIKVLFHIILLEINSCSNWVLKSTKNNSTQENVPIIKYQNQDDQNIVFVSVSY